MVRVRLYGLVLSLPLLLLASSIASVFFIDGQIGFNITALLFVAGIGLQLIFALAIACPKCGKSLYAIGPSYDPFSFAGKPWPDDKSSRCGHDFMARN